MSQTHGLCCRGLCSEQRGVRPWLITPTLIKRSHATNSCRMPGPGPPPSGGMGGAAHADVQASLRSATPS